MRFYMHLVVEIIERLRNFFSFGVCEARLPSELTRM